MAKRIEFEVKANHSGVGGFYIHVQRGDAEFIAGLHSAATQANRPELARQIERFSAGRVPFAANIVTKPISNVTEQVVQKTSEPVAEKDAEAPAAKEEPARPAKVAAVKTK